MDSLFPKMPKVLADLSDKELSDLLAEHEHAFGLWKSDDPEFLGDRGADEVLEQGRVGAEQIKTLIAETESRAEAEENYVSAKSAIADEIPTPAKAEESTPEGDDNGDEDGDEADEPEAVAETAEPASDDPEPEEETAAVEDRELVLASAETTTASNAVAEVRYSRPAPPQPADDRVVVSEPERKELSFVASGLLSSTPPGQPLTSTDQIAQAIIEKGKDLGSPTHNQYGREESFRVAHLDYSAKYDEDHTLRRNADTANGEKLRKAGNPFTNQEAFLAMTASGGICAPAENIYTIPQLAVQDRPVRDGLPSFRAERGAINVSVPGTIGDAAGAITVITEAEDASGGTFATKACLDVTCPTFNETAVTVIAHCREFGNLNAMSWPEFIANQNELTMAEHARVAEGFLLGQIKAQSLQVSSGAETLSALSYLVDAITKTKFGIRSRLRMPNEARFVALLPRVVLDILLLDTVQKQFDSYRSTGDIEAYLASTGIDVVWYMDTPLLSNGVGPDGPSMIADAAQGDQAALESFPDVIQWGMFPAGTFLHIDMAELNLGIVRDSTLNSTNDFQIFGETFENVARIGPPQAAYWETTDICATGQYPPLGTARTCD